MSAELTDILTHEGDERLIQVISRAIDDAQTYGRVEYQRRVGHRGRQTIAAAVLSALRQHASVTPPEHATRRVVDGRTDPCPAPGYRLHIAVGTGAISSPYLCHGCSTWFTLDDPS